MKRFFYFLAVLCLFSCTNQEKVYDILLSEGVSRELADLRSENFTDLTYNLHFNLPSKKSEEVVGHAVIEFKSKTRVPLIVDFFAPEENIKSVKINSIPIKAEIINQHIFISEKLCKIGLTNKIEIDFVSTNTSLNRRDDFMYTLLVPDRARTLFPLFEQPNLKAKYTLSLSVPSAWTAISNSRIAEEKELDDNRKFMLFNQTEPISSYLFAFAAGVFSEESREHKGRTHKIYHRETDPQKLAQLDDIFKELFHSLDWLEEYTDIDYPFSKYDMVIIPGFQYGGMEHIGATFYNASSMFTSPTPTIDERVRRATLVAHETSHMWFGDLVTMEWFDDVWTKEVFANYFAAKIATHLFLEMDNRQTMLSYFSSAFSEDRTVGGTSIKQKLDNLRYAGLVYNSIIYNKSPLVLNMIAEMLGEDAFREAISECLKKYSFANASWEQWVEIFDAHSDKDITLWAKNWMYESGMPTIEITSKGRTAILTQKDPKGRNLLWEQPISFAVIDAKGRKESYSVNFDSETKTVELAFEPKYIIPNNDGMGYGYFVIDDKSLDYILDNFTKTTSSVERRVALINIYENVLNDSENISEKFILSLLELLPHETNPMIYSTMINYISSIYNTYFKDFAPKDVVKRVENIYDDRLWSEYRTNKSLGCRVVAFKSLASNLLTEETRNRVYDIWEKAEVEGITLGIDTYMSISYNLALKFPLKAEYILKAQLERITNTDLQAQYRFISQSVVADSTARDKFFFSLLEEENRGVESWVQTSLSYLMAKREGDNSRVKYILPALNELEEIQQTGDIFFPQGWCRSLLGGCRDRESFEIVDKFLAENKDMQPMLRSKLLNAADHLYRKYGD